MCQSYLSGRRPVTCSHKNTINISIDNINNHNNNHQQQNNNIIIMTIGGS